MDTLINILILEHDPNDIGLLQYELKKSGLNYTTEIVQSKEAYEQALCSINPDIILSDFSLPSFDGLSAFRIRENISPQTPFIIVSGTIGEENAVELIKMGVTDYALKEKLYQITPKIRRALKEAADRKQKAVAELQLKEREEQLRKIMDLSLDVICTVDQEGRFVTVGAASKRVWGFLPEELVGRGVIDLVQEEDKERTSKAMADLRNGVDMVNFENRYIRKNGESVTLLWSSRWDPNEKLEYSVARDATEIKKAEEKIKNNEKRFKAILQNSTDGLTLAAADGTVIERSLSAQKILGLDASETLGKLRLDLIHPDDLSAFNEVCTQVKHTPDKVLTVEYRFRMPYGSYKWVETTLHNQLQEPAVGAIVLNFRDITERKAAEIALEKSEVKYRSLFNLSPIPMWVFDMDTLQFLDVNEAAIRHYGYSKEEFFAMTLKDIKPRENAEEFEKIIASYKGTSALYHDITKHIKKGGKVIDVEIKSSTVNLDSSREARLVIATDISEQLEYIKAIEEQNIKLREIAWIQSHVVRAPLARIMGLISLFDTCSPEKDSDAELLSFISASAHELDGIIREIVRKTEQVKELSILEVHPER
jgi:PAS domain S-box-containing protein